MLRVSILIQNYHIHVIFSWFLLSHATPTSVNMQYGNSNVKMHGVPAAKFAQAVPVQTNLLHAKEAHNMHAQGGPVQHQQAPERKFNDVGFAVLFWAHFALIVALGVTKVRNR